jgi:hypothetical protein
MGKPASANNDANVHFGKYKIMPGAGGWNYMSDANNWFLMDGSMRKQYLIWWNRVALEFVFAEEIDTIIAKWRAYSRYSFAWYDWRFVLGGNVS